MNLIANNIHIWYIPLNIETPFSHVFSILSTDEQEKANNFYFEKHKKHYVYRRFALRKILSKYYNIDPKTISFSYNDYQKPYIEDNIHLLQFNMSASNIMAMLAITKNDLLGIDIECIKPIDDIINIAKQFFSSKEISNFLLIPEYKKLEAFYTIWTRKEAFIKAIGDGLSYPINNFDVSFLPRDPIKIFKINNSTSEATKWSLTSFDFNYLNNLYITAIIIKSTPKNIIPFYYPRDLKVKVSKN